MAVRRSTAGLRYFEVPQVSRWISEADREGVVLTGDGAVARDTSMVPGSTTNRPPLS
jgi:hypothetical protein